MLEIIFRDI